MNPNRVKRLARNGDMPLCLRFLQKMPQVTLAENCHAKHIVSNRFTPYKNINGFNINTFINLLNGSKGI